MEWAVVLWPARSNEGINAVVTCNVANTIVSVKISVGFDALPSPTFAILTFLMFHTDLEWLRPSRLDRPDCDRFFAFIILEEPPFSPQKEVQQPQMLTVPDVGRVDQLSPNRDHDAFRSFVFYQ